MKGGKAGRERMDPWKALSWPRFLVYFGKKNGTRIALRSAFFAAILWAFLGHMVGRGGGAGVITEAMDRFKRYTTGAQAAVSEPASSSDQLERASRPVPAAVQNLPTSTPDEVITAVQELRAELEASEEAREKLQAEVDSAHELVGLTEHSITLRSGDIYALGEEIQFGTYEGLTLEKIERKHRYAVLSDGSVLRMGTRTGGVLRKLSAR